MWLMYISNKGTDWYHTNIEVEIKNKIIIDILYILLMYISDKCKNCQKHFTAAIAWKYYITYANWIGNIYKFKNKMIRYRIVNVLISI